MRLSLLVLLLGGAGLLQGDESAKRPCVFCGIAEGKRDASVVYRDDTVMAFLDIDPVNPGHTLVVPVQHSGGILDLPPDTAKMMMALAQRIARALQASDLKADGIQLLMNTGAAANQTVFHAHLHIVPRHANDGQKGIHPGRPKPPRTELEAVAAKLQVALKKAD